MRGNRRALHVVAASLQLHGQGAEAHSGAGGHAQLPEGARGEAKAKALTLGEGWLGSALRKQEGTQEALRGVPLSLHDSFWRYLFGRSYCERVC